MDRGHAVTFFDFAKGVVAVILRSVWRLEVHGAEHVPREGALIVAANHVAYMDPPALGVALPRPISYMAKAELFRVPVLGPILPLVNAYPVDRGKGDIAAIRRSLEVLAKGGAIGIFPEGGRVKEGEGVAHTGVAMLAAYSGAPVLPAYIGGSGQAKRLHKIVVTFGPLIHVPKMRKTNREELAGWKDQIMAAIRALGDNRADQKG